VKTRLFSAACLRALAVLIAVFASGGDPQAATRYVSPDGGNRYPYTAPENGAQTIQPAVDAAEHGGEGFLIRKSLRSFVCSTAIASKACRRRRSIK